MGGIDIELTNRCNAKCYFCPRDQTPHEGLMSQETFDQALARAVEFREFVADRTGLESITHIKLCGLGEPLLNKRAATSVAQARAAGFRCEMASNGALLTESRGQALLDAGLQAIYLNVGERDQDYDEIYGLPWEKTLENVVRFAEMADGRCDVVMVLVDHRGDPERVAATRAFWEDLGLKNFHQYDIINRGGALFVEHMQYDTAPESDLAWQMHEASEQRAICPVPFLSPFVGYDGQFYLCCSDWKKEVPLGSVHDVGFADVVRAKLEVVSGRANPCPTCNFDPVNALTEMLQARAEGEEVDAEGWLASTAASSRVLIERSEQLVPGSTADLPYATRARKRIPLLPS